VNLTDGLDGLAAGSGTFCFGVLAIIGYWQFRHFSIYHLHAALDLGLVGVGLVGHVSASSGERAPARIIMGDTGSLAIGTGLGALCLLMNLDLLLPVIGTLRRRNGVGDHAGDQLSTLRSTDISDCAFHHH